MRNQTSFRLTTTLLPTDTTAKATTVINKVDENGDKFYPTFTEETVVLTNDDRTVMETTRAICTDWVLTFVKRGLSDDNTATEITNRKLTWNPWTLAFITAGASDMIDVDDDLIWTGNQTYTGSATYQWMLTTAKWVKYPNFANVAALNAYANPYGWMFATVDDTWELYRYNAVTEQWDLVSTVELSQYIIRAENDRPAPWTADNIITFVEWSQNWEIFLWDRMVANGSYCVDAVVVWWWGGGGNCDSRAWWWAWAVIYREWAAIQKSNCIVVWEWWSTGTIWWASQLWKIIAWWWWGGGVSYPTNCNWSWWGWSYLNNVSEHDKYQYHGMYGDAGSKYCSCQSWQTFMTWFGNGWWAWSWVSWVESTQWWLPKKIEFNNWQSESYGWWWGWACFCTWTSSSTHYACADWNWYNLCWSGWIWMQHDTCQWCAGKDWVVQVMYPTDWSYGFVCATGGNCCYTCNGYKVHRFTSDWTFTICY